MNDETETKEETETRPAGGGGGAQSLDKQLEELKDKQAAAAAEQIDKTVADLEKLIADSAKADEEYRKKHPELVAERDRLTNERDLLKAALEGALTDQFGADFKGKIEKFVTDEVQKVTDAAAAVDAAKAALGDAQDASDEAAAARDAAAATLEMWRKAAGSIAARQATADGLVKEIKSLRNANKRAEAYWKLALAGTADVPGQAFLSAVLDAAPKVIAPGALAGKIRDAWNDFKTKRVTAEEAAAALKAAEAELKAAKATLSELEKNLIKAITGALGAWENPAAAE